MNEEHQLEKGFSYFHIEYLMENYKQQQQKTSPLKAINFWFCFSSFLLTSTHTHIAFSYW